MPNATSPDVAESATERKSEPVQFQALTTTLGVISDDRRCVLLTFGTHERQRVSVRLSRKLMLDMAAQAARLEGYELQKPSRHRIGAAQA